MTSALIAAHGLKYVQSGFAQSYIFVMIVGAVAIAGYLAGFFSAGILFLVAVAVAIVGASLR